MSGMRTFVNRCGKRWNGQESRRYGKLKNENDDGLERRKKPEGEPDELYNE